MRSTKFITTGSTKSPPLGAKTVDITVLREALHSVVGGAFNWLQRILYFLCQTNYFGKFERAKRVRSQAQRATPSVQNNVFEEIQTSEASFLGTLYLPARVAWLEVTGYPRSIQLVAADFIFFGQRILWGSPHERSE